MEIEEKYPLPWQLQEEKYISQENQRIFNICDATGYEILSIMQWNDSPPDTIDLLKFIVEKINGKKSLSSITDQPCQCSECGWTGTVWDTESVEDDGNLGCPECLIVIEVL